MSAGKGDGRRPFDQQSWDEGYARIDFSAVRKPAPPAEQPEVIEVLPWREQLSETWMVVNTRTGAQRRYHAGFGPVTAEHVRNAPGIRYWAGGDPLEVSVPKWIPQDMADGCKARMFAFVDTFVEDQKNV